MPPSTSSASRRKHVTTACVPCRESKIKCDGVSPICSNCKSKGKDCRYQAGDDKRKLSLRVAIELLSGRIEQLCQFIRENNLHPPSMVEDEQATLMKVLGHLRLASALTNKDIIGDAARNSDTSPRQSPNQNLLPDSNQGNQDGGDQTATQGLVSQSNIISWNRDGQNASNGINSIANSHVTTDSNDFQVMNKPSPDDPITAALNPPPWAWSNPEDPHFSFQPAFPFGTDTLGGILPFDSSASNKPPERTQLPNCPPQSDEGQSDTENTEALVDQLSDRVGALQIGPGGQVRYYGPTSNFNLVEMPAPDNLTVHRTVRNDGQEYLDRLGIGKEVPPELEEHLANLYFAWQDPAFHVVNRGMFEAARVIWREKKEDTPYYSEALQNSICALGAAFEGRHHPTFVTFPKSLADFFADRAKALLEIELDCPCVATVQAMVVLSSHDIGCKRDARGWLYSGMAMRLAFDLALHVDMSRYVAKKSLTQAEADLRRDVFWGAYTVDHMWGFYLGRPFRLNMEDVTVAKPGGDTTGEANCQWIPYVSPKSFQDCTPLLDYTNELHRQRVLMVEIMAPLGHALYGSMKIPPSMLQDMNATTVGQLLNWKADLPPALQIDLDDLETHYLPHVILLHMQYHQNIIHAHRPWMSKTYTQPSPPQGPGSGHARMMCVESAYAIAKLLQLYEIRYALRRMNIQGVGIACSAALLLIFAAVTNYQRQGTNTNNTGLHLSACFRALDDFGASWESAKRARDFLILLQRQWELQGRSARVRRTSQPVPADSMPRKRTRTSSLERPIGINQAYTGLSPPRQQSRLHGASDSADVEMGLDLDWILTGDTYALPQGPLEGL
ncbi:Fc.00g084940.m01.CDS01 [Cosmosporella sp. VM-42]